MTGLFFVQAILLVGAISLDALVVSFSYGVNKIKIPIPSVLIITIISTIALTLGLYLGSFFSAVISEQVATAISASILILIGVIKLSDSLIKSYIKKHQTLDKKIYFKFLSLQFMLNVYADPLEADTDESKTLSAKEAIGLAFVLSLDGLTAGFGAGLSQGGFLWIIGFSLIICGLFIFLGALLGRLISKKSKLNLSWLSGTVLIVLGIVSIFI